MSRGAKFSINPHYPDRNVSGNGRADCPHTPSMTDGLLTGRTGWGPTRVLVGQTRELVKRWDKDEPVGVGGRGCWRCRGEEPIIGYCGGDRLPPSNNQIAGNGLHASGVTSWWSRAAVTCHRIVGRPRCGKTLVRGSHIEPLSHASVYAHT